MATSTGTIPFRGSIVRVSTEPSVIYPGKNDAYIKGYNIAILLLFIDRTPHPEIDQPFLSMSHLLRLVLT